MVELCCLVLEISLLASGSYCLLFIALENIKKKKKEKESVIKHTPFLGRGGDTFCYAFEDNFILVLDPIRATTLYKSRGHYSVGNVCEWRP